MLTYSRQPEYRRVVRRRRDARARAELRMIRATVRAREWAIVAGPDVPLLTGPWSNADEAHALSLRTLGVDFDRIGLVLQRSTAAVEGRLYQIRHGRPLGRNWRGQVCAPAEARS